MFETQPYLYILHELAEIAEPALPVFTGTASQCRQYAKDSGFQWVADHSILGGYFRDTDGSCLLPDIVPKIRGSQNRNVGLTDKENRYVTSIGH